MKVLLIQHFPKGHRAKGHFILSCRMTFKPATDKVADLQNFYQTYDGFYRSGTLYDLCDLFSFTKVERL